MLDDLIAHLIELIAHIWSADTQMRDQSLLGESEDDKQSRRFVAVLCGGAILLLICVAGRLVVLASVNVRLPAHIARSGKSICWREVRFASVLSKTS
jgi:hypothetical protein